MEIWGIVIAIWGVLPIFWAGFISDYLSSHGVLLTVIFLPKFMHQYMSHLLLLGKFEYGGGPIFKVVLEC